MHFVSTFAHGIADYVVGIVVAALPLYFRWSGPARTTFVAFGLIVIFYSLFTDYELGLVRFLRIRFHLLLDALFGIAMLAAPTLLHLASRGGGIVYLIGALALLLTLTTKIRAQGTHSATAI
jgi:hypothetical protein